MKVGLSRQWKRRLVIIAVLMGIYWGVQLGDWILLKYVFSSPRFTQGAAKITLRHFKQPDEHPFSISYWKVFLDKVTRHKPGILAYKSFYVVLLAAYLISAWWLFLELTSDRLWLPSPPDDDTRDSPPATRDSTAPSQTPPAGSS